MGHLGSRVIASVILEKVSYGKQTDLCIDLPWETVCVHTRSDPRVRQDSKTNRTFFVVLHGLEEEALQPNSFRRCDLNYTVWLITIFGHLQSFQIICWDKLRV